MHLCTVTDELKQHLDSAHDLMQKACDHLEQELNKLRAGKASPAMLEGIRVDYYGSLTPLSQVANVNTSDARTLQIQPYEKSMITPIEKAISMANMGLNPTNDGNMVRIIIPPITEERRKDLVKKAKAEGESGRVTVRNIRRDVNEHIKKALKDGLPEDEAKDAEAKLQEATNKYVALVDDILTQKEKEIMTV